MFFKKRLSGVSVPHHKTTADFATVKMPVPDRVSIPVQQHMGPPCDLLVKVGDMVKVGQKLADSDKLLTAPIHSGVSGKVTGIEEIIVPQGTKVLSVVIETDKLQEVDESVAPPKIESKADFLAAVRQSGLVGLGGAGFPTHVKLNPKEPDSVDTLIINIAECEPYITSDYRNCLENGEDIIAGIELVLKYLPHLKRCVIGIESNKMPAVERLEKLIAGKDKISIKVLSTRYPQGAEKVLIYEIAGRSVPDKKIPADIGVIVLNGTTVAFIAQYVRTGMPLVTKRMTVDGSAVAQPKNVEIAIGTSFADVVAFCGGYKKPVKELMMGGPMMGISVYDDSYPVLKNNNALLCFAKDTVDTDQDSACIRCGRCQRTCPYDLQPQFIDKALQAKDIEALETFKVVRCMECGSCAYACPAKRHLVLTNRMAKKFLRENAGGGK